MKLWIHHSTASDDGKVRFSVKAKNKYLKQALADFAKDLIGEDERPTLSTVLERYVMHHKRGTHAQFGLDDRKLLLKPETDGETT